MAAFPVPASEEERLSVLRGLGFKRLCEARFGDRLVELGATHFNVSHCFIGAVQEDVETFFAATGIDMPDTVPREETLCAYTITEEHGVLVVEDVQHDERIPNHSDLKTAGVQWYAGAPLIVEGEPIGTFCLMDEERHDFPLKQRDHLKLFAEEASEQIELRNKTFDSDLHRIKDEVAHALEAIDLA